MLVNDRVPEGAALARRYAALRGVPKDHIVALSIPEGEVCSRKDYDTLAAPVVREALSKFGEASEIRCLLAFYGLPLEVAPPEPTPEERRTRRRLMETREALSAGLKPLDENDPAHRRVRRSLRRVERRIAALDKDDQAAAFDSELALVRQEFYPLSGWRANPRCVANLGATPSRNPETVLMTCRLDGPTPDIVARVIDDSIRAETQGLTGIAYFDARWPRPEAAESLTGYALYDDAIHRAARWVRHRNTLPVVLDARERLFQPGECPNAALYCGWYSLAKYIEAFSWRPGAVGYHIASGECATLKRKNSQVWCKRMLESGAAAVIGPVNEPYVQAFPLPDLFFGLLLQGRLSLVECYFLSLPHLSWQMVLVGDPLYTPFSNRDGREGNG